MNVDVCESPYVCGRCGILIAKISTEVNYNRYDLCHQLRIKIIVTAFFIKLTNY